MRRRFLVILCVLAGAFASLAPVTATTTCTTSPGSGGDWTSLTGDLMGSNNQWAEDVIGPSNVAQLEPVWSVAGTAYQSVPVVSGSCVYVILGSGSAGMGAGSANLEALDLATGEIVFVSSVIFETDRYRPFAPAVADGRVHVNWDNHFNPKAAAFDANTGELIWESDPITFDYQAWQLASARVFNGMQLIHTTGPDFDLVARPGYGLLDAATGATLHKQTVIPPEDLDRGYAGGGVWSTPAVDLETGYSFAGTANPYTKTKEHHYDNAIIKIDVDPSRETFGQVVDHYKATPDNMVAALYRQPACGQDVPFVNPFAPSPACAQTDVDFGAGPTLWRNDEGELMLAELQKTGMVHAVYADSMSPAWAIQLGTHSSLTITTGNFSPTATDGRHLFVATNPGVLWALDLDTGLPVWATPLAQPVPNYNVIVANGVVYAADAIGVRAWDAETGLPLWQYSGATGSVPINCAVSLGGGGLSLAHHTLVVNCAGTLVAFRLPASGSSGPE